jgi:hypothetical protein
MPDLSLVVLRSQCHWNNKLRGTTSITIDGVAFTSSRINSPTSISSDTCWSLCGAKFGDHSSLWNRYGTGVYSTVTFNFPAAWHEAWEIKR